MPLALILSSFVAGSRIGGAAQQYAFAPFGIDPVLVPTVLFGPPRVWEKLTSGIHAAVAARPARTTATTGKAPASTATAVPSRAPPRTPRPPRGRLWEDVGIARPSDTQLGPPSNTDGETLPVSCRM